MQIRLLGLVGVLLAFTSGVLGADTGSIPRDSSSKSVASAFKRLSKPLRWTFSEAIPLSFPSFHSQGLVKIGNSFFLSSVETIEKPTETVSANGITGRTPSRGIAHLFKFDAKGQLAKDLILGEKELYHPGGLDYDGRWIWVPVAEYRSKSRSIIYKVDPNSMQHSEVFQFSDHIGSLTHNPVDDTLVASIGGAKPSIRGIQREC